jgi:mRNA interferase MazF
VKRGEIWIAAGGKDYAGKPRPVVILQDDRFDALGSITVCPFTTDPTDAPLFRLPIEPNDRNGLQRPSRLMVDKITTVPKSKIDARIGRLGAPGHHAAESRRSRVPEISESNRQSPRRASVDCLPAPNGYF